MVKLTQVHKIQIYLFYSLGSIKKNLKPWNNGLYLSNFKVQNSSSILLRETFIGEQFLAVRGQPVWPVSPTGLTGHAWQLPLLPLLGENSKTLFHSPLHRHPFVLLSFPRVQGAPLAISSFNQGKGDPFVGFESHHRSDRIPKRVHLHLLRNRALKVLYGLFLFDLLF